MLFELHLVQSGRISASQLVGALAMQVQSRPKLGRLACKTRELTMKQVFAVLQEQADRPECFGETAVRLGFLTEGQVSDLLRKQRELTLALSECLIETGAIDSHALELELDSFSRLSADLDNSPLIIDSPPSLVANVAADHAALSSG